MTMLNNTIWGSRLFVNAQFVSQLVFLLIAYNLGECTLSYIFRFVHALEEQKQVKLYKELKIQLEEFVCLDKLLQTGEVTLKDTKVINFTVNRMLWHFTGERIEDCE